MIDQAEKLRKIVNNLKNEPPDNQTDPQQPEKITLNKRAKVITITSGKGGVGKTSVTSNLAIALSQKGYRVVIIDADLGLSNIDVVFGIVPKYTLLDSINSEKGILDILCDGPNNIKFISGGSGVQELINLDKNTLEAFTANMSLLDHIADYILIDTGAGLSDTVMNFVLSAEEVLLVVTPEPTSITDAYALVKTVAHTKKDCSINVLINRAESEIEAKTVYNNFSSVAERFLGMKLEFLGYLPFDQSFIKSVKLQRPYLLSFPKNYASRMISDIADALTKKEVSTNNPTQAGIKGFINRFVGLFSNK
ncbi:MAG: ATPase involved in chromosome partitioning [Eubacterium sp.]|jgi:flagellar biosynthesis protein FlhG|nr:ATPase involved in chromosome partitioning [Eubacterium sp.]